MRIGTKFRYKSFSFAYIVISIFSTFTSLPTAQATSCTATLSSTTNVVNSSTATMCILKISGSLSWTAPAGITSVNILAVGGGGGADHNFGGGGGGGQVVIANSTSVSPGTTYSVVIGAGGAKGYEGPPNYTAYRPSVGGDTRFGTLISAVGGGLGGSGAFTNTSGGSSGGGGEGNSASNSVASVYPAPILTFGNRGGAGSSNKSGGGGGGAGGVGNNAGGSAGGAGGAGLLVGVDSSGQIVANSGSTYVGAGGGGGAGGAGTSGYTGGAGGVGGGGSGGGSGATANGGNGTGIGAGGGGAGQGGSTQGGTGAAGALWITFEMPKPVPSITFTAAFSSFNLGTSNTLTATVVAGATGTITFTDSVSGTLCTTGSLNGSGIASCEWTPSSAGSYTVTANYSGDSSYASTTSASSTITVSIATTTLLAIGSQSLTYGAVQTLTATIQVSGSTANTNLGTVSFQNNGSQISNCQSVAVLAGIATCNSWNPIAGSYSNITAVYSGAGIYSSSTSSNASFTVSQGTPTFTWENVSKLFGSGNFSITAPTPSTPGTFSYSSADSSVISLSGSTATIVGVGSSVITATFTPTDTTNYNLGATTTMTITVGKATPTLSNFGNVSKTYGASTFDLTAPTSATPGTWTYSSATTSVISLTGSSATVVGAGTSVITATFTPDDISNYNSGGTISMTITVGKATLGISASSHTVAYGDPIPTISPIYSGFVNGDNSSVISGITCSTLYTTTTSVGTTSSSCTGATASNYSFTYSSGVITITQGGQTSPLSINSLSVEYGSTLSITTTGGNGSGSNSFNVDSGPCTLAGSTLTPTAAGTCMVTATKAANGNYLASNSVSTAITVTPKSLTISGLTGVNKVFDGGTTGSVTGTPTLVGVVGSDDVLPGGVATFTFASANVANGITLTASGYTLTGTTASNYTLTQPSVTANITAKSARVAANNVTIAQGGTISGSVSATGLISPDAVSSASYTYTGTGTSTPPSAVGVYTVTPSSAVFSTGLIGNYTITYDTATVTILAKYTITYNANGGQVSGGSTSSVDFVIGDNALTLPTPTRANYTFTGWYTLQSNGVQVTGSYTPTATATLWARWVQNSLYGMGTNTKVLTITTLSGVGNTYSANAGGGTIAIEYLADALPAGTVIDAYVLSDTSTATSLIGAGNDYVMSLVLAWVATDGTVPTTAAGKAIAMTITNSSIRRGSKIYSVIGNSSTLLGTAAADGVAVISITDDPQIIIAITKPDAPTGVSATSGGNASSTVSWTAPSDGGSAITSYTATSNAGQTCTSVTTTCSITGLTNGTPYTFTVTATNAIGVSDPSSASSAATPAAPVVTPPSSGGGGGGYVAPTPEPTPTVDPAVAAAAAAKALADAKAAEEKALAEAKALAEKRAAEEAELLATIKALQEKADAEALAAAKKAQEELAAAQLKAEEELKLAAALKLAEEQRIAAERAAAAKRITTVYSTSAAFKLNKTYTKRLDSYTKRIASGSTVTCIGYAKSSKTLTYAKAKDVATKQAKALCSSMKKINPTLKTKSIVYPASKAPKTAANKKWIPVSYRVEVGVS
jgi:uncharacterized repeat protein (TIGR02543 family)